MRDKIYTLPKGFSETVNKFGDKTALSLVGEKPISYNELNTKILSLIKFLEDLGYKQGDKIAILSTNVPNWGIAYFAVTFMGAVAVPLLPDFLPYEIENILKHSESKGIFVSDKLLYKIENIKSEYLIHSVNIENFEVLYPIEKSAKYIFNSVSANKYEIAENDLAAIIYTSGTTGTPKGVMLSHKNICITVEQAICVREVNEKDRFLSILPLSHTYENTLGFVMPMLRGSSVYYLGKQPTPAILLPALLEVKPTMIFAVPLIIEKIYRNRILPAFTKSAPIRVLYKVPFIRKKLNKIAGAKLLKTFGGELEFFGIGGAKLDRNVEKFLIEAGFPYSIGYGLTETAPLLAGMKTSTPKLQSTGPAITGVELKINNPDKKTGEGEIWARGANVMLGYYKEPKITAEVITEDGWFKTGDLGVFDKDNFLYIKGRIKNIIIGASGENIYPEDIESVINNFPNVLESLVIQQKGKIVALVHLNIDELKIKYTELLESGSAKAEAKITEILKEIQVYINQNVNKISQVQAVLFQNEPFQKTATQKIKRFMYN